jgi:hypothetical protein
MKRKRLSEEQVIGVLTEHESESAVPALADISVRAFQQQLAARLRMLFVDVPIETEWATMHGENGIYSPRLDVAVGPFAVGNLVYVSEFNQLVEAHHPFVRALYELSVRNFEEFGELSTTMDYSEMIYRNANARCLLAFEIENNVSRKHLMGGAINAAALGRIGIAVGWTREKVKALVKLRAYLLFLARVGKNSFSPYNLLVLSKEQLYDAVGPHEHGPAR